MAPDIISTDFRNNRLVISADELNQTQYDAVMGYLAKHPKIEIQVGNIASGNRPIYRSVNISCSVDVGRVKKTGFAKDIVDLILENSLEESMASNGEKDR